MLTPWQLRQRYEIQVTLQVVEQQESAVVDQVHTYFGMRKIEVAPDLKGSPRIMLNGRVEMNIGLLDQGFWPDGLYTAPSGRVQLPLHSKPFQTICHWCSHLQYLLMKLDQWTATMLMLIAKMNFGPNKIWPVSKYLSSLGLQQEWNGDVPQSTCIDDSRLQYFHASVELYVAYWLLGLIPLHSAEVIYSSICQFPKFLFPSSCSKLSCVSAKQVLMHIVL